MALERRAYTRPSLAVRGSEVSCAQGLGQGLLSHRLLTRVQVRAVPGLEASRAVSTSSELGQPAWMRLSAGARVVLKAGCPALLRGLAGSVACLLCRGPRAGPRQAPGPASACGSAQAPAGGLDLNMAASCSHGAGWERLWPKRSEGKA